MARWPTPPRRWIWSPYSRRHLIGKVAKPFADVLGGAMVLDISRVSQRFGSWLKARRGGSDHS
jgi:hypothetical protein